MFYTTGQFYRSREWEQVRRQLMLERRNDKGEIICEVCHKPITNAYDCIGHHVKYLNDTNINDYDVSLNPDNIWLVHHACHNEIHNRFGAVYQRHIYLVYGSPCAGKTTYVLNNALPEDLIVDIDRIFDAVNISRSKRVFSNVMDIYRLLLDMIKTRNGRWVNAWVISASPMVMERQRLADMLGAELIHIDTPKEVCLERAKTRVGRDSKDFVEKYWENFRAE